MSIQFGMPFGRHASMGDRVTGRLREALRRYRNKPPANTTASTLVCWSEGARSRREDEAARRSSGGG